MAEHPDADNSFGTWLSAVMRARGLRTAELARIMGVQGSTVSKWRLGRFRPDSLSCRELADALHVPAQEVLVRAGHVDPATLDGGPVREQLHDLVNMLEPDQLEPILAILRRMADPTGSPS